MSRALLMSALFLAAQAGAQAPPASVFLQQLHPGGTFSSPIAVRHAADGSGRLFIVQRGGIIRVRDASGQVLPTPLLTISVSTGGERGLLGLAFHPDFDGVNERRFYVSYSATTAGNPHALAEFRTQVGNPNVADASTRREVMSIPDLANNHNGGDLHFGPDGYLYWSIGDGGPQGDPHGFAQCLWRKAADDTPGNCGNGAGGAFYLLGKILRIDPTTTTASATADMCAATTGQPAGYSIPPTNPFVGTANTCDEIVHYGMRNPWRFSFDRINGDLYIGDVGQGSWEETTRIPAGQLGVNLGWRCHEGHQPYAPAGCTIPTALAPFQSYSHGGGRCSITGGFRYRGPVPGLANTYFSGDYCTGQLFYAVFDGSNWSPAPGSINVWTPTGVATFPFGLVTFGEDELGNLYVPNASDGALYVLASSENVFANGFE